VYKYSIYFPNASTTLTSSLFTAFFHLEHSPNRTLFSSLLFSSQGKRNPSKMQPQKLLTLMALLAIGAQALPANAQNGKFHLTPSN
jgi:hypothetical protein